LQTKARRLRSRNHEATEESKPETIVLNGKVETTNGHQE